tara:strand:+ start:324 stop:965 length:642 start_codon:yes stop_codon:yes gene_type:complete
MNNPLLLSRLQTGDSRSPWYALGQRRMVPNTPHLPMGQVRPVITKAHTFATKKRRAKDYSSDSSGTEREIDKHTEGRIYRAPAGSGKDYYVYCECPRETKVHPSRTLTPHPLFCRARQENQLRGLEHEKPQQRRRSARKFHGASPLLGKEGQEQGMSNSTLFWNTRKCTDCVTAVRRLGTGLAGSAPAPPPPPDFRKLMNAVYACVTGSGEKV